MAQKKHTKPQKPVPKKAAVDEEDEDDVDEEKPIPTLREQFESFAKFKREDQCATHMKLSESDYWMKQAGVIKGRELTSTDTGVCFFKFKKSQLNYEEYLEFLQVLADYKKIKVEEIMDKMVNCGPPSK